MCYSLYPNRTYAQRLERARPKAKSQKKSATTGLLAVGKGLSLAQTNTHAQWIPDSLSEDFGRRFERKWTVRLRQRRSQTRQNSFISSGLPNETRTNVFIEGNSRAMAMLFLRKCSMTAVAGRPAWNMAKFVEEGIN